MEQVILLLGGNIGDVASRLDRAVEMIGAVVGVSNIVRSSQIETIPWGFNNSDDVAPFINEAVMLSVDNDVEPLELLDAMQGIERELGRVRDGEMAEKERLGESYLSRMIDIDIIFWGDRVIAEERLTVPHPLMQERDFVLRPIVDIAADFCHPLLKQSCSELLCRLDK